MTAPYQPTWPPPEGVALRGHLGDRLRRALAFGNGRRAARRPHLTVAEWMAIPADYRHTLADGTRARLTLDPVTGATVLEPITLADQ